MSTLDDALEIDHPVWVTPLGTWQDVPRDLPAVHAPEIALDLDNDGQLLLNADDEVRRIATSAGWDVLDGYSGQYGYRGPIMHASEFVSGRLEDDIMAEPGVYVVTTVECVTLDGDREETPAGWVALRLRHADYPHFPGRLHDCIACELGPCTCGAGDAPCTSRRCNALGVI